MNEHKPSVRLDGVKVGDVYLTLASWQPYEDFPPSYEIGYREHGEFELIQFSGMSSKEAFEIAKRAVANGGDADDVRRLLNPSEDDE